MFHFRLYSFVKTSLLAGLFGLFTTAVWSAGLPPAAQLAVELSGESQWEAAALEFRRLAMQDATADWADSWYWMSAYEYAIGRRWPLSAQMLTRAEDASANGRIGIPLAWLRAENAMQEQDWSSAMFYYSSLRWKSDEAAWQEYALRGEAAACLRAGDSAGAIQALEGSGPALQDSLDALLQYTAKRDKKPWLGGVLGMVPGLGYAYSGEYANGLRSLLLNSLFIWAMVETADEDQWALFTVSTFFELTWYTGSIYGGIDSAHRHNQQRQDAAIQAIRGPATLRPDTHVLPIISLQFQF